MFKDLRNVLGQVGINLRWHETLLLIGTLAACLFALLCLRFA